MQPALVYAALALTTLMRSSELELGASGRSRAMWLRDVAQSELDKSWNTQFIDYMLAEAALLLALFESSAHPTHSLDRLSAALVTLDGIISVLNLTCLDVSDRAATHFGARHVPVASDDAPKPAKCTCISHNTLPADHFSSSWTYSPPWDPAWNPTEVRNEECRRLCWCALNLVAAFTAQCAVFQRETPDFFLANSANYALFFPGESMSHASAPTHRGPSPQSPKDSVWAIYCRSMLLWNFCLKLRKENCSDEDRAEYALEAWIETQAILDALETHICNLDTAILYMCREYIYKFVVLQLHRSLPLMGLLCSSRMTITQTFRSLQGLDSGSSIAPVFNRKHAEEWLYYQAQVIQLVKQSVPQLGETQGHMLTRRPFQVGWFTSQLAICLSLWNHDHSLINALDLAKSILMPLDVLNALWPCPMQQNQCESLRKRLSEACTAAGLPQPLPTEYNLPAALRGR
ncbi:hypothetical protein PLICRDRAFT_679940 [Plicaturopsis crispa FD-325 SS-3]|nr:hypothetical protein PLICRDRAFT_679940 [Plicaturopsis crispa FD-325 SS-3]